MRISIARSVLAPGVGLNWRRHGTTAATAIEDTVRSGHEANYRNGFPASGSRHCCRQRHAQPVARSCLTRTLYILLILPCVLFAPEDPLKFIDAEF